MWTYDAGGNITSRKEYAYTTGTPGTARDTVPYSYYTGTWRDLIEYYDGEYMTTDTIGNLVKDAKDWIYTWEHGRELATLQTDSATWTYTYDANGMRTKRTSGSTTYSYIYNGSQLTQMTVGSNTLRIGYDANGPMFVKYNGATYQYVTNLQGDVIALLDHNGNVVVEYTYDAWGNILTTTGSLASTLGVHNPLRYRGYVYDQETELYYLQSRYYDPQVGRFINADGYVSTGQGLLGNNMFAYCLNNPVMLRDFSGYKPGDRFDTPQEAAYDAAQYINKKSIEENREYGTYIYAIKETTYEYREFKFSIFGLDIIIPYRERRTTVKYIYTEPIQGTESAVNFGAPDPRMTVVASFHTHAAYVPNPTYSNDYFSPIDIATINQQKLPGYLVTPYGALWLYDPLTQIEVMLYTDLPFDPNHPAR